MTEVTDPALWWKQAVVYQVYPRSRIPVARDSVRSPV